MWDTQIHTDRKILANKPDLVVKDKKKKQCLLIDVAVPSDYNITQKEAEKQLKYKDLQIEIQRMWNIRTKVIPIIIGATGLISKTTAELIEEVPGKHNLLQMQRAVVLGTAHIISYPVSKEMADKSSYLLGREYDDDDFDDDEDNYDSSVIEFESSVGMRLNDSFETIDFTLNNNQILTHYSQLYSDQVFHFVQWLGVVVTAIAVAVCVALIKASVVYLIEVKEYWLRNISNTIARLSISIWVYSCSIYSS
ncbi:hypothetical protein WDU94_014153 [Cyamophila willieti]